MNTERDMTDAEYASDPYWKATEDIIYELAEHHANGLKWPCSECSGKVQEILKDWFPERRPAPEPMGQPVAYQQLRDWAIELDGIATGNMVKNNKESRLAQYEDFLRKLYPAHPPVMADAVQEAAAEVYQCVGTLLSDAGRFDSDKGCMLLDLLSWMSGNRDERPDTDKLLPFASLEHSPAPGMVLVPEDIFEQLIDDNPSASEARYLLGVSDEQWKTLLKASRE